MSADADADASTKPDNDRRRKNLAIFGITAGLAAFYPAATSLLAYAISGLVFLNLRYSLQTEERADPPDKSWLVIRWPAGVAAALAGIGIMVVYPGPFSIAAVVLGGLALWIAKCNPRRRGDRVMERLYHVHKWLFMLSTIFLLFALLYPVFPRGK